MQRQKAWLPMINKQHPKPKCDESWYLAQYKPNAAQIAVRNLENQSFCTFLPLLETTKRKGKIFQRQIRPLFPGYVFVQLNPNQGPWRRVNSTRGIARLVCNGTKPSVVPSSIVTALMTNCDKQSVIRQIVGARSSQLQVGGQAQVTRGPLSGFLTTVTKIEPNNRIKILIEIMGHKTEVAVNADAIQPVR